jgi:hypothetical protein
MRKIAPSPVLRQLRYIPRNVIASPEGRGFLLVRKEDFGQWDRLPRSLCSLAAYKSDTNDVAGGQDCFVSFASWQ